jgi:hypothetical protein
MENYVRVTFWEFFFLFFKYIYIYIYIYILGGVKELEFLLEYEELWNCFRVIEIYAY